MSPAIIPSDPPEPSPPPPSPLETRLARLFRNGSNLAVRIPVDWNFDAREVVLSFDGKSITIVPVEGDDQLPALFAEFASDPLPPAEAVSWQDPEDLPAEAVVI